MWIITLLFGVIIIIVVIFLSISEDSIRQKFNTRNVRKEESQMKVKEIDWLRERDEAIAHSNIAYYTTFLLLQ